MLGYVTLGANDFERAKTFYRKTLEPLGARPAMSGERMELYSNGTGAMIGVCIPYDKEAASPGNGVMPAISAPSREVVDQVHAAALAAGGICEGPPGERMPTFYGAYFRDTEGNKVCVYKMG